MTPNGGEPGGRGLFPPWEWGEAGKCWNIDLASIATLPTEDGDGLEEQDMYSP